MRNVWLRHRQEYWLTKGLEYGHNRCPYRLLKSVLPRASRISLELHQGVRLRLRVDGDDFQGVQDDQNERVLRNDLDFDQPLARPQSHQGRRHLDRGRGRQVDEGKNGKLLQNLQG